MRISNKISSWFKDIATIITVSYTHLHRPNPGIFLSQNKNTSIHNVKIHYAEGMGLLAQLCENKSVEIARANAPTAQRDRFLDREHFCICLLYTSFGKNFTRIETLSNLMGPDETLVEGVGDRYAVITPPNATLMTEELYRCV